MTGWLRYSRPFWLRTDDILDRHWLAVKMLAPELRVNGMLRRDLVQEILDRWMPLRGESIPQALGWQEHNRQSPATQPDAFGAQEN
jgi:hypothetical protein